ncbi:probable E3 SUMO-protein ligase RNF212 isoform X10 [Vicugna pacos]|uniref:Probable E3 SUMO-protein ligase RNF212 isoform X10 n=1 Tax=Vicugna pacos TaxID=30538 RepID=A0ABM5C4U0_VICPA
MSALRGGPHWAWTTARCPQENPWAMQRWDERGGSASRSSGQTEPQRERSDSGLPVFLGKRDECLICKVPCRTILLSKHTDSDIRALFLGIDGLCRKYSMETSQVSEFQEKHRRRLLAFYGEKISSLEESLRKSALQLEQLQSVRLAQQTAFGTIKTPVSTPTAKPSGPVFLPPDSSASQRVESMEVDLAPSPRRKLAWGEWLPCLHVWPERGSRTRLMPSAQAERCGSQLHKGTWPGLKHHRQLQPAPSQLKAGT